MISEVRCADGRPLSLEKFCDSMKIEKNKCNVFLELSSLDDLNWDDVLDVMLLNKVRCYVCFNVYMEHIHIILHMCV